MNDLKDSCGVVEEFCICRKDPNHNELHECRCGGSWGRDDDGTFIVGSFPSEAGFGSFELTEEEVEHIMKDREHRKVQ